MKSNSHIVIIDDDLDADDSIIVELSESFDKVTLCSTPEEGIEYVSSNLDNDIIVLLDIDFPGFQLNGHKILDKIREKSFLIPVIIWSSINEEKSEFSDLINNKAFAFVKRTDKAKLLEEIAKADSSIHTSVAGAIEDWINSHPSKNLDDPFLVLGNGKTLTLKEVLSEVRLQTDMGKKFRKDLIKLTIDLLVRKKEKLND